MLHICCGISSWSSGSKHTVYEEGMTSGGFIISFNPAVRVRWSLKQLISRIYHLWKWLRGDFQLHVWWILRVFVLFFADSYRSRPSNDLPFEHESLNHSEIMYIILEPVFGWNRNITNKFVNLVSNFTTGF